MASPNQMHLNAHDERDRKSTRLNSSHLVISYAVFCLKKKTRSCAHDRRPLRGDGCRTFPIFLSLRRRTQKVARVLIPADQRFHFPNQTSIAAISTGDQ